MKILSVVVSNSSLDENAMGWRVLNIARILDSIGHKVQIVQFVTNQRSYEFLIKNKKDDKILYIKTYIPKIFFDIIGQIKKNRYELVYGNTYSGTFFSLFAKAMNIPIIYDMHGGLVEEFLLDNHMSIENVPTFIIKNLIDSINISISSRIMCVSKKMISNLNDRGIIKNKVYLPNGVDLQFFKPLSGETITTVKKDLGLDSKFIFGYIGNFQKWQGVENFIASAKTISDDKILFLIVGAEQRSLDKNILFIPKLTRAELLQYYSICDVLVLPRPSHDATEIAAPTKFAEYTAMGKPILSTSVGDAADLIKKYGCGIVVENNSIENLTNGISKFYELPKEQLQAMSKNARSLAEHEFDWEKIGASLLL